MTTPFFFGYGSLVNRDTHDYPHAAPARVSGWVRQWKKTRLRRLAYLSVTEAPGMEIAGLVAAVPGGDWAALDEREAAYIRQPVEVRAETGTRAAQIYRTKPQHDSDASEDHPILLSYLDTVLQGFFREFGRDGVTEFIATTGGWDAPVLDDRAAPIYARVRTLAAEERRLIDLQLDELGLRRIGLERFRP